MSSSNGTHRLPQVVLLTSSGAGHLTPLLRVAALLLHHNCQITLITCHPILTLAESQLISKFLSAFPQVKEKQLHLLPHDPNNVNSNIDDPFLLQWETARRSVRHLLLPLLLSLSPFPSALVSDVTLFPSVIEITENLNLPVYVQFPSCARMFCLFAYFSAYMTSSSTRSNDNNDVIEIPGVWPMAKSTVPPLLLEPKSIFYSIFMEDSKKIPKLSGIFIPTLETLESESLTALNSGKVVDGVPPIYPIVLMPCDFEKHLQEENKIMKWLDNQSPRSVVYMNFGSKAAMSRKQIKEIGNGLITSAYPFLWVVKDKELDKEDTESLNEVLGNDLMEKLERKGLVVKEWVNQGEILGHEAVGGFVSHCGWNSVLEAIWHGVRLLAWPPKGDQKVNAEAIDRGGFGLWTRTWGWAAEMVVKGEELGERIKEMMTSEELKLRAEHIRVEARKAVGDGGSNEIVIKELIEKWK
ncbi:hypothetical protein JCGZ_15677 [Jatropha curcas]|uniref:Glycosyltransferase n=1 Tax=Jatropha curcas TaxID=180498 RepID=A0A067L9V9_JATCU|nr:UDP-glycosyltransferase 13 [Jatropha curcas]XP_037496868.1 UDP-glycosyltransferase 13-like [Jatropha curcas]KDP41270.1 hypothetical protein JCGZ_15677 [Jatropha curcas]